MKVVSVVSGKGGVGKTTISIEIAKTLSKKHKVGFIDADVTGANTHQIVKIVKDMHISDRIEPAVAEIDGNKIQYVSIALISETYVNWSGKTLSDFIDTVFKSNWDCEFLIIDTPPGNHEENKEILKRTDVAVLVTIPSELSNLDLKRTIELLKDLNIPIAGVYINMSYIVCNKCGNIIKPFKCNIERISNIRVIEKIPFFEINLDYDNLIYAINNPVKIKKSMKHLVKRKFVKMVLRGVGKL